MSVAAIKRVVTKVMNFYRRPLPAACISFSSPDGKQLFKEALLDGYMENYFRLASQLHTQEEPAFCGLATLVMVLNALEIDPGRIWKGPWRWYHESMLDCCIPLDTVKHTGITFDQFVCIAKCNGLTTDVSRMSDSQSFDKFKQLLMRISRNENEILVTTYSRKTFGQTGDGHFAPVGGYHPLREMVLLFDTARFKYPSHWVPVRTLWDAMHAIDKETGQPRGYVMLTKDDDISCLILLATSVGLNEYLMSRNDDEKKSGNPLYMVMDRWQELIDSYGYGVSSMDAVSKVAGGLLDEFVKQITEGKQVTFLLTCHGNFHTNGVSDELEAAMTEIVKEIVGCKVGATVANVVNNLLPTHRTLLATNVFILPQLHGCALLMLQDDNVRLTFLLTSWLFVAGQADPDNRTTTGNILHSVCTEIIDKELSLQSKIEITQLTKKFQKMSSCRDQRTSCCNRSTCGTICQ